MDYWALTMQDDLYLISQDGWVGVIDKKPNTELIPSSLIVKRFFDKDSKALEDLQAACDGITQQMEELAEEHGAEDGTNVVNITLPPLTIGFVTDFSPELGKAKYQPLLVE